MLIFLFVPAPAAPKAVSLNLCTDALLVMLAPEQALALSPLARDPALSTVANQAQHMPWVRPDAEAVLRLQPDLVLAGNYGAQAAITVLKSRGLRVVQVAEPTDFQGVAAETATVAAALGVPKRGAALIQAMQSRLAKVRRRNGGRALLWQARGFTAGPGSFGDTVLRAAGLKNVGTGRAVGLEALLTHPPDLLVTETAPAYPSLATDLLSQPAVAHIPRVTIPPALLACAGPWSVQAVEILAR